MPQDEHHLSQGLSNFGAIASFSLIMIVLTGFYPKRSSKTMPNLPEKKYTYTMTMTKK